ncbi:hypothetical protein ELG65_32665 [Rhizobium leguminosarum]|uniref:hypothetical protein n=1 Tax=Rhizobium leguminosarum TaxID=384 RepID=UPI00102FDFDA|nr:hypothetical protein [Rhizobium leguminosarum]TBH47788.1 hypothetical protein ELG65_32665 [Rhizobium leguminosarum]
MTGTLAIWHEPIEEQSVRRGNLAPGEVAADCPTIELHINLWRDSGLHADFVDVGIKIKKGPRLKRLLLFVPAQLQTDQLLDLSSVLKHGTSLNAVFNDLVEITDRSEQYFDTRLGRAVTRIHSIDLEKDITLEPVEIDVLEIGTVISFNREFCDRFQGEHDHYIRFRIYLTAASRHLFSSEIIPNEWFLLPSFQNTELTEFRLNERRTIPPSLIKWFENGPINISTVHYFLIRDLRHELMMQHRDFRKIRVLEPSLWRHYLRGRPPETKFDLEPYPGFGDNGFVIYHWKESGKVENGKLAERLEDFNAFAKFRMYRPNLVTYAYMVTIIGAVGSAFYTLAVEMWRWAYPGLFGTQDPSSPSGLTNSIIILASLIVFFVALWALLTNIKVAFRRLRAPRDTFFRGSKSKVN